jgi:hypothetical protein
MSTKDSIRLSFLEHPIKAALTPLKSTFPSIKIRLGKPEK